MSSNNNEKGAPIMSLGQASHENDLDDFDDKKDNTRHNASGKHKISDGDTSPNQPTGFGAFAKQAEKRVSESL